MKTAAKKGCATKKPTKTTSAKKKSIATKPAAEFETVGEMLRDLPPLDGKAVVVPVADGVTFVLPESRIEHLPKAGGSAFFLGYDELSAILQRVSAAMLGAMLKDMPMPNTTTKSGMAH